MSIPPPPGFAHLPDCPDTRLLVELTSHANDLSEAANTIAEALRREDDSPLWLPLTMHAVTAYTRPFTSSTVRRRLDEMPGFPGIPAEMTSFHATVRRYRNSAVAHSQSDLAAPLAIAILDDFGRVVDVVGVTVSQHMPPPVGVMLSELIDRLEEILEGMIDQVRRRLLEQMRRAKPSTVARWPPPEITAESATSFSAARPRQTAGPSRVPVYWSISTSLSAETDEPGGGGRSTPQTGTPDDQPL